jgi:hypothetical protein
MVCWLDPPDAIRGPAIVDRLKQIPSDRMYVFSKRPSTSNSTFAKWTTSWSVPTGWFTREGGAIGRGNQNSQRCYALNAVPFDPKNAMGIPSEEDLLCLGRRVQNLSPLFYDLRPRLASRRIRVDQMLKVSDVETGEVSARS